MTVRAPRGTSDVPSPSRGPSFVRRHPILAAFGVLAGLSLFAAYWPISAIVVGIAVAGRASGADLRALSGARRVWTAASGVVYRWFTRGRGPSEPSPEPRSPAPAQPGPAPRGPEAAAPRMRSPELRSIQRVQRPRSVQPRAMQSGERKQRTPADTVGAGIDGPG